MNFSDLQKRVESLIDKLDDLVLDSAMEEKDFIVEANQDQLWEGKTSTDEDIRPYYTEDPYFKTKEQALAYGRWKQAISHNPNRGFDVPNLYINGYFYRSIEVIRPGNFITTGSKVYLGQEIYAKYKNIRGLNKDNLQQFSQLILPNVQKKIKNELTGS